MNRRVAALVVALSVLAVVSSPVAYSLRADARPSAIGASAPAFSLPDTTGQTVSLASLKSKKAVVVIFMGTECVINNAYLPRLVEMQMEYGPRGVQILGINSNLQDSAEQVAEHARRNGLCFPVLKDEENAVADGFGAQRTPEVFLLDTDRKIRYHGRIDDQFGIGYKRAKPTTRELLTALDELLAGKPIAKPTSQLAGCIIARASKPRAEGSVTYTKHVARIMQQKCQECHRPGEAAPMSFLSYRDTMAWADTIREVLNERRMPPWHADPQYGHFANDRSLSNQDRATLLAWLDQGTPKGDNKDMPPPRAFVRGWQIGKPDVVFEMPSAYNVPADMPRGGLPYQRFRVHTNFKQDRWVERAETRAGVPSVVHHIIIWVVAAGEDYQPGNPDTQLLCGTAPGDMPQILPPGTAKKIPAGADLIFELHYTPNGTAQKDRSRVGIIFARQEPKYEARTIGIANNEFQIPAGADNQPVEQWFQFPEDSQLLGFMPHLHLRGKDFKYSVIYPDGKQDILLSIPRYDFNWQSAYREAKPLLMPKGTKIHCEAHFDNSAKNLSNPDSTIPVRWGDQTWEEMMIGWIDFATKIRDR